MRVGRGSCFSGSPGFPATTGGRAGAVFAARHSSRRTKETCTVQEQVVWLALGCDKPGLGAQLTPHVSLARKSLAQVCLNISTGGTKRGQYKAAQVRSQVEAPV